MKKTIAMLLFGLMTVVAANAQYRQNPAPQYRQDTPPFGQGKLYFGTAMSSFDIGSLAKKFHVDLSAKGGYMLTDNILALGDVSYNYKKDAAPEGVFSLGAGMRYYIEQNGLFLGAGAKLYDITNDLDFQPNLSLGYAFFLSRTVTVEPELYFNLSTEDIDNSNYGFRIGFGIYLFNE